MEINIPELAPGDSAHEPRNTCRRVVCRGRGEDWDMSDLRYRFIGAPYNGYAVARAL